MYRIGDFSRLTSTSIKTLRYYDEIGLLRPARIDPASSYRSYSADQVEQLNRISVFKDLGFSLREIRALLAEHVSLDNIGEMVRSRHRELERQVATERARLARAAARLNALQGIERAAAFSIAVRSTSSQLVASVRDTLHSYDECERLFDELHHHLGAERRLQRGAVWHACTANAIDCEAFVVLPSPVASTGRVRVYEFPGGTVASFVYRGEDEFLPAYRALRGWVRSCNAETIGPKREIFLDDGGRESQSVTEVQLPIRGVVTSDPGRRIRR